MWLSVTLLSLLLHEWVHLDEGCDGRDHVVLGQWQAAVTLAVYLQPQQNHAAKSAKQTD